jgi:PAS domain S-box-containing protein
MGGSGIIRLDTELVIVSLDQNAGRLLEFTPAVLLGRRIDEVVNLANLGNLMRSGISFSNQVILAGTRRLACDYVSIAEDDRIVGGVLTLLSPLSKQTSGSSDDLKELLRSAGDFMNLDYNGIVIVDSDGNVVMVNQAFAEVLGTTTQAMIGKHVYQAYPNSQPSHLPMVLETGKPEIGITHYLNGKQVYASLFPLIKDGKVIGGVGKILFKDIREISLIANRLQAAPETRNQSRSLTGKESLFRYDVNTIVGQSSKIVKLKEALLRVAQKNSNVLLLGESGTGKELFAHAIHAASTRRYAQFVKVNCAAIPEHLLESELFGYSEGAFTGAKKGGQIGKFEQAHTGTIFLDEIGDMPLYMQSKMLRVLQERELTQLGSTTPKMVDVRVVAATNSNLEQLVKEGKFREDLYYRLKVVTLTIPPLRERMEDIYSITKNFIHQFNAEFEFEVQGLDQEAWDVIRRYDWPGNIRELRNVIESAFNAVTGPVIMREHLPDQLSQLIPRAGVRTECASGRGVGDYIRANLGKRDLSQIMDGFEKQLVDTAVELSHGNKLQAAQLLGISRQWLYKKLQKYGGEGGDTG